MILEAVKKAELTARQPSSNVTVKGRRWLLLSILFVQSFFIYQSSWFTAIVNTFLNNGAFV